MKNYELNLQGNLVPRRVFKNWLEMIAITLTLGSVITVVGLWAISAQ